MTLEGKTAIITGAAQGIGFEIAKRFCTLGASVALVDNNEKKLIQSVKILKDAGADVIYATADVSCLNSVKDLFAKIIHVYGKLDILVNNAGILRSTSIMEVIEEEWDHVMEVNLKSVFFTSQQATPYLKNSSNPRIINISSLAGRMGGLESGISYATSKGGIISMTYNMAKQLAPYGITVNAVCPGTIDSDIIKQWSEEQIAELVNKIPLGRLGTTANVASAVAYLATDEAGYITGLLMDVNGGVYFG